VNSRESNLTPCDSWLPPRLDSIQVPLSRSIGSLDLRDVGMVQCRQNLGLKLEPS
jgi:hypothetical protein